MSLINFEGSNKKEKLETENPVLKTDEINNINSYLNNDCLIQIFQNLSLAEKLKMELVCKRWQQVGKLCWSKVNRLFIDDKLKKKSFKNTELEGLNFSNISTKINFFINVIKRCCSYLNYLEVKAHLNTDYSVLINFISKKCQNIIDLHFYRKAMYTAVCPEEDFALLFKNNKKLTNIYCENIRLNSNCFSSLFADSIQELCFDRCSFLYGQYFCSFLSKLKNLKKFVAYQVSDDYYIDFELTGQLFKPSKIILALNESKCKNIFEFNLGKSYISESDRCDPKEYLNELSEFLSRQKNLSVLRLEFLKINNSLLESIPSVEILQELELTMEMNETEISLDRFKNLTVFKSRIGYLNDESIQIFTKCINLKEISLFSNNVNISPECSNYFNQLEKLESFTFVYPGEYTDDIIKAVSQCRNLKKLDINGKIKNEGIESICSIQNLQVLKIIGSSYEAIANIVINCLSLKKLVIKYSFLTYNLLKNVNDIKTNRGDEHILEINGKKFPDIRISADKFPLILYNYNDY